MLKDIDFKALSRQERNAAKRIRLLALAHFQEGMSRARIATLLKVSRTSVNKWVAAFLQDGLAGLDARPPPGRPPSLTPEQRTKLSRYVEFQSQSDNGGRLPLRRCVPINRCHRSPYRPRVKAHRILLSPLTNTSLLATKTS